MRGWLHLKPGDVVDIIATTPGIKTATLEIDCKFLCCFVESLGLVPRLNISSMVEGAEFFSPDSLKVRQQELKKALYSEDSKAIWCIRGGYGTAETIKILDKNFPPKITKLIIGYSDINCLHLWLNKFWDWPTMHARVLYEYLEPQEMIDIDILKRLIFGIDSQVEYDHLLPLNEQAKINQNIIGKVTGGTIQVLQSGIGLPWQFDATDKIILFEELFDRGVRLDRTLNHFESLGLLANAKAIIFGDILCGKEIDGSENCDVAVKRFAQRMEIPVFFMAGIGHGKFNHPIPLNSLVNIEVSDELTKISIASGAM